MSNQSTQYHPVDGLEGVFVARSGPLTSSAIRLQSGGFCLYSPLPGLENAEIDQLSHLGNVAFLLAPNHYHHRGIASHLQRFPKARLVCSAAAMPRLRKQTGREFEALDVLSSTLPPTMQILEPAGLKTGEVWMQAGGDNSLAWIVCDGFNSEGSQPAPGMLSAFPKFGIRDRAIYFGWVKAQLAARPPTILIPCHGAPLTMTGMDKSLRLRLDKNVI